MATRNFTALKTLTTVAGAGIGVNDTSVTLASIANLPTAPFTAAMGRGTAAEEVVLVTALNTGTGVATISRNYDGTGSFAHNPGDSFEHVVSAIDYREANAHVNDTGSGGAHGVVGGFVDLNSAQTIAGAKTFSQAIQGNGGVYDSGGRVYSAANPPPGGGGGGGGVGTPASVTRARAHASVAQSIPTATWTAVALDVVELDTDGLHSTTNTSRFVIQQTGTYIFSGVLFFDIGNGTGVRVASLFKNGVGTGIELARSEPTGTGGSTSLVVTSGPVVLNAGDYVELGAYQNSGAAINTLTGSGPWPAWLGLHRIDQANYSAGVASGLIGKTAYNPNPMVTVGTTAVAPADIDATNLKVTFVAPASGQVIVRLTAAAWLSAAANGYYWGLASGGVDVVGSKAQVAGGTNVNRETYEVVISGLAAGQQYTYTWRHWVNAGTVTGNIRYGDDGTATPYGAALMEVYDATIGVPNASFPKNGITQPFLAYKVCSGNLTWSSTTSVAPTFVDVDATNAVITFVAPASGSAVVYVEGIATSTGTGVWALRDTTTNAVAPGTAPNGNVVVSALTAGSTSNWQEVHALFRISGLMPGQTYSYKLSHAIAAGNAGTMQTNTGDGASYAIRMYAQDAVLSPNMTMQSANPFLLGKAVWNPTTTTNTTLVNVTAMTAVGQGLQTTFVAPASGSVLVRLSAFNSVTAGKMVAWGLLSGGTEITRAQAINSGGANFVQNRVTLEFPISGLVPGQQYTYQWGWACSDTATTATFYGGNDNVGPAVMEVWDGTTGQGTVQTPPGLTTLGRFRAHQLVASSAAIATGTWTKVASFDTVDDDPLGKWDAANSQWVAPTTSTYIVSARVEWAAYSTGSRAVAAAVNGTRALGFSQVAAVTTAGDGTGVQITQLVRCNAGDVITIQVWQDSGTSITLNGGGPPGGTSTAVEIQQLPDTSHAPSATSASQVVGARVYLSANYALAAINTLYTLSWTATEFDKGGYFASAQPTRLTVPTNGGGTYRMAVHIVGQTNSGASLNVQVFKNGTATGTLVGYGISNGSVNGWLSVEVNRSIDLNPGDYIEVQVQQSDFAGATVQGGAGAVHLTSFELIRENSIALTDPTSSKGDMVVRSSGGALSRLAAGSDGAFLAADSSQALGVVYRKAIFADYWVTVINTNTSPGTLQGANFAAGADSILSWSAIDHGGAQSGAIWAAATPSRFYAPVTGLYRLDWGGWFTNATATRMTQLLKVNGTAVWELDTYVPGGNGVCGGGGGSGAIRMNAGDYVELAYHPIDAAVSYNTGFIANPKLTFSLIGL